VAQAKTWNVVLPNSNHPQEGNHARKNKATKIALLVPGLVPGCCWLPRGIQGLIQFTRVVTPIPPPDMFRQFLHLRSDPLSWYDQRAFQMLPRLSSRVTFFLTAAPNYLCGIVAIVIIGLVIFFS
jgi:hypothetical protein